MRTLKTIVRQEIGHSELKKILRRQKGETGRARLQHLIIIEFDFSPYVMAQVELYNVELQQCCFRNSVMGTALFGECDAAGADFRSVTIEDGDVIWSELRHAKFDSAGLQRIYFFKTDLSFVSFRNADLYGANFVQCDLAHADFTSACLEQAQFVDCRLLGVKGLTERVLAYEPAMFSEKTW
jgi:uncharacterized protein YjbI with pentapeptide repeats